MMTDDAIANDHNASFTLADLRYELPEGFIAQHPLPCRDASRLLVLDRASGNLRDSRVAELPELLQRGDLLILNDTKVLPAKFTARRRTGGKVRGLFIEEENPQEWRVMLEGSRRLSVGETLIVTSAQAGNVTLRLLESCGRGYWRLTVDAEGSAEQILGRIGLTPLPPYIRRGDGDPSGEVDDRSRYQTVYAQRPGAITPAM